MAVGSGRVTTLNQSAVCAGRQITPIPRERDNSDDLAAAAFAVRTRWAQVPVAGDFGDYGAPDAQGGQSIGPVPPMPNPTDATGSTTTTVPGGGGG